MHYANMPVSPNGEAEADECVLIMRIDTNLIPIYEC